jgi:heat shock protein HspQ
MTDTTLSSESAFGVGQVVRHRRFGYRGVVYDVDPWFMGTEEWYEAMATSRPPKDRPWYHVLVDGQPMATYVAERNLEPETAPTPIEHPYLDTFFNGFDAGKYRLRQLAS